MKLKFAVIVLTSNMMTLGSYASVMSWNASSGLTPDQVGYQLLDNASPENPTISSSVMTLSTSSANENMYFSYSEPTETLDFPGVFEASFTMRLISGSNGYDGRAPAGVFITVSNNVGSSLWIGQDELFMGRNFASKGPSVSVDTDGAFHDYLFRISGSSVSIYQDGSLVLSDSTLTAASEFGVNKRVAFGEATGLEYGTSEWKSFSHNAAIPEPGTIALVGIFGGGLWFVRRYFPSV
ncbi:hypothetical protein PDESU_01471 [Pontiella desulfatans]|uniref:PEP-CTERM protein-sorting domain-containing protein n=1 Tax=Pontiella desulfatans TaxID=2750659 RepID=A0A6C2TZ77_PONDE|nr:PEP-CTERM sorting domain-containing protein [Pontiella desulfatans]VGO12917.1 hypothetical protein PDESU_01471 [Pontiella desulfatans]